MSAREIQQLKDYHARDLSTLTPYEILTFRDPLWKYEYELRKKLKEVSK